MRKRRENVCEATWGGANGVREKMGWKILGGRKVRSERKDGIGWECSGRVEGRGRSEVIGLETFLGVGEDVGWVKKRERVSFVRRVPGRRPGRRPKNSGFERKRMQS